MPEVTSVLGAIAAAVAVVAGLGGLAVYLGRSSDTGTIASLERQNATFEKELGQLRGVLDNANNHIASLEGRVASLESENASLLALRPSSEAIAELSTKLDAHLASTTDLHEAILANLEAIRRGLDAARTD